MPTKDKHPPVEWRQDTNGVKDFFDHWSIYQKAMDHNYLCHREVYGLLQDFLEKSFDQGFSLLDLGCGDASFMSLALKTTRIKTYCGVDLSPVALSLAQDNMASLDCKQTFVQGDFFSVAQDPGISVDVIWVGLSLHHLPLPQKERFLEFSFKLLNDDGCLLIYEPTRRDNEDRESYLQRWCQECQTKWLALSPPEIEESQRHVQEADFPESVSTFAELGTGSGFARVTCLFTDPDDLYGFLCFDKNVDGSSEIFKSKRWKK
jgi:SAM-dependent methyltransferase